MKKSIVVLFSVLMLALSSFVSFGQEAFVSYEVNGKPYSANSDQFISYIAYRTNLEDQRVCKYLSFSISGIYGIAYTAEVSINFDTTKALKIELFKLYNEIEHLEKLPTATLKMVRRLGEDYEFYSSENNDSGNITITKVDGDWIEGTFEGNITPQYPLKPEVKLKVTKGKFRVKAELMAD
jgi:hypothetical protein